MHAPGNWRYTFLSIRPKGQLTVNFSRNCESTDPVLNCGMHLKINPLRIFTVSATSLLAVLTAPSPCQGALILYEGFDYGGSNVALNTISGAATGLTGSYAGSGNYNSTGLTFSNLETTGGRASFGNTGSITSGYRQLSTGTISGTIYGSFIYQQTQSYGTNDVNGLGFGVLNPSITNDNTNTLSVITDTYNNEVPSLRSNPGNTGSAPYLATGSGTAPDPSATVRMALFEVTNVGAVSGTQQVTMWILEENQFNNFRPDGLSVTELNSASVGTGSTEVFGRVTLTINGASGYIGLGNSNFLTLMNLRSDVGYDEIRISTSSLNEATPVPEPGSVVLLGLAGMVMMICRRRGRKI